MRPLMYSDIDAKESKIGWQRCGENIAYFKNDENAYVSNVKTFQFFNFLHFFFSSFFDVDFYAINISHVLNIILLIACQFSSTNEDDDSTYTLTFNIEFPHDNDTVYFAHTYPYTYSDLQVIFNKILCVRFIVSVAMIFSMIEFLYFIFDYIIFQKDYLMTIQKHPIKSKFCKLRLLCRSLAGNNVYCLTVTAPVADDEITKVSSIQFNCFQHIHISDVYVICVRFVLLISDFRI